MIIIITLLSVLTAQSVTFTANVFAQPITAATPFEQLAQQQQPRQQQIPEGPDMVLLSARFNDDQQGGQIVGEVKNNGTKSAEFIEALATFREVDGAVVDVASTFADKQLIVGGDVSPFNLFVTSDVTKAEASTYDLTLKWQDLETNQFAKNGLSKQPLVDGSGSSGNGNGGGVGNGDGKVRYLKPCIIVTIDPPFGPNETLPIPIPVPPYPPCPPGLLPRFNPSSSR